MLRTKGNGNIYEIIELLWSCEVVGVSVMLVVENGKDKVNETKHQRMYRIY